MLLLLRGFLMILCAFCLLLTSCQKSNPPENNSYLEILIHTSQGIFPIKASVADTPEKKQQGLMFRTSLEENEGMLFVWPEENHVSFWMKNTPLSLDILFINSQKQIVSLVVGTTPYSTDPISSAEPVQYVLEISHGFVAKRGITIGDTIDF